MKKIHFKIVIMMLSIMIVLLAVNVFLLTRNQRINAINENPRNEKQFVWMPPDTSGIPLTEKGNLIRYGRELIIHTAKYFGPRGSVSRFENGLNCQNCHLAAGTRLFANNFSEASSAYPAFRPRTERYISLAGRVNGCMQRSLNGRAIDSTSREMNAFIEYFDWLGKGVEKNIQVLGAGTEKLPFLTRAADPIRGKGIFTNNCASCHGMNGEGKLNQSGIEYLYPPLWGPHSYNMGAGFYRISKLASFVKNNMPFGTTYHSPVLTNEQAWDVAAFVNSQPHPEFRFIQNDWPDIAKKPFDYPFGPFADAFSASQHKYGPYQAIAKLK